MRNVLITGASRGIGAETARIFAKNGDRVFINYNRSENAARSLQSELSACGYDTVLAKADVSGSKEVNEMFENILHEYGGIDVLVNNAGISQIKLFTDITDDDWNTMLSVNLSGVFYCCRAALPYMIKKQHGRIINISSMWGQVGGSCEVHYSAAKAGVIGLTKALAMEEGLSGITVNCIAPGVIATEMNSHLSEQDISALKDETPTGTIGTPSDVANAVFFLASESASFITGQTLGVNGGFVVN
ncbi:MAG: 3-oxoacyl-ACP reductase FabG [Clostridia bacterium]|nr:3-oxoacyl-ACP reductase FabG [Clostridia bacterium]